jgi:hypothetical protein
VTKPTVAYALPGYLDDQMQEEFLKHVFLRRVLVVRAASSSLCFFRLFPRLGSQFPFLFLATRADPSRGGKDGEGPRSGSGGSEEGAEGSGGGQAPRAAASASSASFRALARSFRSFFLRFCSALAAAGSQEDADAEAREEDSGAADIEPKEDPVTKPTVAYAF